MAEPRKDCPEQPWIKPDVEQPDDLQIVECWDSDRGQVMFAQWFAGPKKFFDDRAKYVPEVILWRKPLRAGNILPPNLYVEMEEHDVLRRECDMYRDMLKGISRNIDTMLKPIGGE
jgi:hypothetical protein